MTYIYSMIIVLLSSFLWRVRGGLRFWGKKAPMNKIWYAVAFACYGIFYFCENLEHWLIGFIACYTSYQVYGWGLYIGRLLVGGELYPNLNRECELIDDLLYSCRISIKGKSVWLYEYPRLFGFFGTTLTGVIITFLWGMYLGNLLLMFSGLGMGVCYWFGGLLEKLKALGKSGWNWGEWIFGAYLGGWLAWIVL